MYPQRYISSSCAPPAQCDIHYARACSINMTERDSDDRRTDGRTDEDTDRRGRARIEAARVSNTSCLRGLAAPPLARQRFRLCPSFLHGARSYSCSPRLYFHPRLRPFLRISSASAGILAREGTACSDGQSNKKQSDGRGAMSVQIPEIFHLFPSKAQNARALARIGVDI